MVTAVNCVCAFEGHAHFSLTLSQRKLPSRVLDNGGPDNRTVLHFHISNSWNPLAIITCRMLEVKWIVTVCTWKMNVGSILTSKLHVTHWWVKHDPRAIITRGAWAATGIVVRLFVCLFVTSESTHLAAHSTVFTAWIAFIQQVNSLEWQILMLKHHRRIEAKKLELAHWTSYTWPLFKVRIYSWSTCSLTRNIGKGPLL